uniref:Uncharacterized protein n=1 Tax=Anguilla anguilla TaxID=7936 RepID=A0A0E9RAI9_ANGAN
MRCHISLGWQCFIIFFLPQNYTLPFNNCKCFNFCSIKILQMSLWLSQNLFPGVGPASVFTG